MGQLSKLKITSANNSALDGGWNDSIRSRIRSKELIKKWFIAIKPNDGNIFNVEDLHTIPSPNIYDT